MKYLTLLIIILSSTSFYAQNVKGKVISNGESLPYVNIFLKGTTKGAISKEDGSYSIANVKAGTYTVVASFTGYRTQKKVITITTENSIVNFDLFESEILDEVIVTGTLKAVSRLESPVPVEVYSPTFFKKNPTPNIFDALQNINGVRPQLNCNVCNTGDIHINGLEGPYTLVMIDGMPIVSGLSTVYGLSGIPNSLIEQVEVVKGPASSLYGSEAVGGLINIITKLPEHTPLVFADGFVSSWGEANLDVGLKANINNKANMLLGVNYFNYSNPIDNNSDNFTDVTLQDRISVFQKWSFKRKNNRLLYLAGRYFYEDRWGGEMQWNPSFRGSTEVYGESIYTSRFEIIGNYQLPISEKVNFQFSYSDHDQDSFYGDTEYKAQQRIGFGQLIWDKPLKHHDLLFGLAARYNFYNDNTAATVQADEVTIPSIFVQDEITLSKKQRVLLGLRYDYDNRHGSILTPRIAYRFKPTEHDIFRINAGTGFRVVNLFTEDHAALTGARDVVITEALEPEQSYNINLNYLKKFYTKSGFLITLDASAWYTYFTNAIIPDYDTNPNQIIYDNLDGNSISKGFSLNLDAVFASGISASVGATFQDVSQKENGIRTRQILTERFTGVWSLSYKNFPTHLTFDYTGNIYGPMRLPLLGELDPRREYSPTWSIQNIQLTYDGISNFEIYGGVKNILDWTPNRGNPFIIARANDPFDKDVTFDADGNAIATADNPYALTFDPTYVYGPNQGRRLFFGLRFTLN
ncbi:outer membrane receptor for ferrienterochelin and colicins [Hyunsoonleella jejuensis]|uniref:Outer membrane receptor for ferrienterochelin and colicins n=1 Tax=Hyunsoonleella jejuensis TaxID=419940 RepID=A0A1H9AQW1_9FLAO|nr:TonB-dependent receptor [Hyunsoonleella jejuensis]SEP79202.1 outer membrane receptor for ferrienterochelin and colicins [Hyunsoonleella jejuensis]